MKNKVISNTPHELSRAIAITVAFIAIGMAALHVGSNFAALDQDIDATLGQDEIRAEASKSTCIKNRMIWTLEYTSSPLMNSSIQRIEAACDDLHRSEGMSEQARSQLETILNPSRAKNP